MTWTDAPVPLYVYAKKADRGTVEDAFANPEMDDYHFITGARRAPTRSRVGFGLNDERISGENCDRRGRREGHEFLLFLHAACKWACPWLVASTAAAVDGRASTADHARFE